MTASPSAGGDGGSLDERAKIVSCSCCCLGAVEAKGPSVPLLRPPPPPSLEEGEQEAEVTGTSCARNKEKNWLPPPPLLLVAAAAGGAAVSVVVVEAICFPTAQSRSQGGRACLAQVEVGSRRKLSRGLRDEAE